MSSIKRVDYQTMKCLVLNTTQKALLIASEGKEFWVPISVIEVLSQDGDEIEARIPVWVVTRGKQRCRENAYRQARARRDYDRRTDYYRKQELLAITKRELGIV